MLCGRARRIKKSRDTLTAFMYHAGERRVSEKTLDPTSFPCGLSKSNMNYLKKVHMLCISRKELEEMYKQARRRDLFAAIVAKGYSIDELKSDKSKMQEVVDYINAKLIKETKEVETFVALFEHLGMYPEGSEVCFVLKDTVDPRKKPVKTLEELKLSIKEGTITDFGIMSEDGLRQFQLKQYQGALNTGDLFSFINESINHYGKDLGHTNLLVILQSKDSNIDDVDFEDLNKRILGIGIKSDIEVLVSYNEDNKFDVINVVYPILGTCRKERPAAFKWYSEGG